MKVNNQEEKIDVDKIKREIKEKEAKIEALEEQIEEISKNPKKDCSMIDDLDWEIMDLEDEVKELEFKLKRRY